MLEGCVEAARAALGVGSSSTSPTEGGASPPPPSSVFQNIRFLHYERAGSVLPPHVDLCRVDEASGLRSTHTFILYGVVETIEGSKGDRRRATEARTRPDLPPPMPPQRIGSRKRPETVA